MDTYLAYTITCSKPIKSRCFTLPRKVWYQIDPAGAQGLVILGGTRVQGLARDQHDGWRLIHHAPAKHSTTFGIIGIVSLGVFALLRSRYAPLRHHSCLTN